MSGTARVVMSKLTAEGKIGEVNEALAQDINAKAKKIKDAC